MPLLPLPPLLALTLAIMDRIVELVLLLRIPADRHADTAPEQDDDDSKKQPAPLPAPPI